MLWQKRISLNTDCTADDLFQVKKRLLKQIESQLEAGKISIISQRVEVHLCVDYEANDKDAIDGSPPFIMWAKTYISTKSNEAALTLAEDGVKKAITNIKEAGYAIASDPHFAIVSFGVVKASFEFRRPQ